MGCRGFGEHDGAFELVLGWNGILRRAVRSWSARGPTFPATLKTAPFPALKRGQSKGKVSEGFVKVLPLQSCFKLLAFHVRDGGDASIHGLATRSQNVVPSFQGLSERRSVRFLLLRC